MFPFGKRQQVGQKTGTSLSHRRYGVGIAFVNVAVMSLVVAFIVAPAQAETRLLALGDSLTAGYGLAPAQGFEARLQAKLAESGLRVKIIDAGVSGDTSTGGLARLDDALKQKPDAALVELGANDALRGMDPKLTYANLDQILARLNAEHVRILLLGMRAPGNWGRDYATEFDAIYPRLAAKYQVPLYPFFLDGVALDPKLNQADLLHPNAEGVDVIVAHLAPFVIRLLSDQQSAR
jgi:acyl-CoA thioesterase-1